MKTHIDNSEKVNLKNDGTLGTFFLNGQKYTGKVFDTWEGKISCIFDVKDGVQHGIERTYHEGTNILEQIAEFNESM